MSFQFFKSNCNFILSVQCSDSGISLRSGRTVPRESSPAQNINNNKHASTPTPTPTQEIASLYKTEFAGETVFLQCRREVGAGFANVLDKSLN